ncbi:MAG TPA: hypothetical protein VH558_11185 [Pseudolabrys sp.]|jgi:hypothetical protein
MHTTKTVRSLALVALLAAGMVLVADSQGAFARQPVDHRTNPTGAGPNRSGKTGPSPSVVTVKPVVHQNEPKPRDIEGCLFCTPTNEQARTSQNMQTLDHRTNPTGAGSTRSSTPAPAANNQATSGSGSPILWNPTVRDGNGKMTNGTYSGKVVMGTTKDGKPIYSDYRVTQRLSKRYNKDSSVDLVYVTGGGDGPGQNKVVRYKEGKPADLGGNCLFGICW